ncbi:copper resistance CopC family protein [Actinoplanes friuliensis]|jgi:copper resistance protein C|uniref:Putative copper resistance protein CopC n=1 Tax=Actinoplanes friuliensis DSM 7358 TaxID=1246995 RepID=U5VTC3_9ACTN|nr:copper resistance CopC family protein [Actinoplanes friuliensis]AGZ38911.1 putative copper resistance protein CopC [Actinoplanes friuliensis DSM 7358]
MRLVRSVAAALVAATLAVLAGGPAWAHNSLVEAAPKKDAKLAKAPAEIRLKFIQKLDGRYMTIVVSDEAKQKVAVSAPKADGKVGSVTFSEPLPNGVYTVAYRVVSQDGHAVQGAYSFTVQAAGASTPSAVAPTTASPVAPASAAPVPVALVEDKTATWWPVATIAVAVLLVGAGAFVLVRRRRS